MKSTPRAGQKPSGKQPSGKQPAGPRGAPAGRLRTPAGPARSPSGLPSRSPSRLPAGSPAGSTRAPAAKARGAKGHFFTGPATPAGKTAQQTRSAAANDWDDDDADGIGQAGAPARGTKVRSRRPTGAQELRALRLREASRHEDAARGQARGQVRVATQGATRTAAHTGARGAAPAKAAPAKAAAAPVRSAPPAIEFRLTAGHIALDNLLKLTGTAPSGGAAKALAAEGAVKVDGKVELRKTCKIRAGQLVQTGEARIRVLAAVV